MDVEDLKDTQVILDNIQLNDGMNRKQVWYSWYGKFIELVFLTPNVQD